LFTVVFLKLMLWILSVAVSCGTARLSTCSLAWSALPARVRIRAGTRNYVISSSSKVQSSVVEYHALVAYGHVT